MVILPRSYFTKQGGDIISDFLVIEKKQFFWCNFQGRKHFFTPIFFAYFFTLEQSRGHTIAEIDNFTMQGGDIMTDFLVIEKKSFWCNFQGRKHFFTPIFFAYFFTLEQSRGHTIAEIDNFTMQGGDIMTDFLVIEKNHFGAIFRVENTFSPKFFLHIFLLWINPEGIPLPILTFLMKVCKPLGQCTQTLR